MSLVTLLYTKVIAMTTIQNVSIIDLGLRYENTENKKETVKPESEGRIESFKPTVSASHRENEDLISPWDWKLPIMTIPRHSATTFTLGTVLFISLFRVEGIHVKATIFASILGVINNCIIMYDLHMCSMNFFFKIDILKSI